MDRRALRIPLGALASLAVGTLGALGCGGCGGVGSLSETTGGSTEGTTGATAETGMVDDDAPVDPDLGALELPAGHSVNTGRVATAHTCVDCHSNAEGAEAMRDGAGRGIAPHDLWRGTMMANAARDPFWYAMVEAEQLATPAAAAAIEAKCMRCHAPLLAAELELTDGGATELGTLLEAESDHGGLGLDGVSCTLCHQIEAEGLGQPDHLSGAWVVAGEGRIYGPHEGPFTMPMLNHVEMTPVAGEQIGEAAMCATCHTLETDALSPEGEPTGARLPEQTPYLEWRNSAFSTEGTPGPGATSCQGCHVPAVSVDGEAITTKIARRPMGDDFPPISPRQPVGRHVFVGGNTTMLGLIRDQAAVLRPDAPAEAFDATLAATRTQLQDRTASASLGVITRDGDELQIPVAVASQVGHKLPTGFPSRRVFVRVELRDAQGELVFRSGGFDERGRLVDADGQVLAEELAGGPVMPHFEVIDSAAKVQIWEAVMADGDAAPTYRLLRGASYLKDNRLLPAGWDPQLANASIAPAGVGGDPDYASAGDTLVYRVVAPAAAGPYSVEVGVYYQALGTRFLAELFALEGPRIQAFEAMHALAEVAPEQLAVAQGTAE